MMEAEAVGTDVALMAVARGVVAVQEEVVAVLVARAESIILDTATMVAKLVDVEAAVLVDVVAAEVVRLDPANEVLGTDVEEASVC